MPINSWEIARTRLNSMAEAYGFQATLARRMNMQPSAIQAYLSNRRTPGLDFLDRISTAIGMQSWELIRPGGALPTDKPKLTVVQHAQELFHILKQLERAGINLDPSKIPFLSE